MGKSFNEKRVEFVGLLEGLTDGEIKTRLIELSTDLLKKAKKGSGIKVDSNQQIFKGLLLASVVSEENPEAVGYLTERVIFDQFGFGFGRHEALTACRNLHIRVPEGEEIIWAQDVQLEDGSTVYQLLGTGADMPDTYKIRRKKGGAPVVEETPVEETTTDDEFEAELSQEMDIH